MQLTIRITCDNAPFEDDPIGEIERVLKQLVFRLARVSYLSSHTMHNHCRNNGLGQHLCIP